MLVAQTLFFPDAIFGWVFYLMLVGFLSVLAYTDVKWIWIPKKATLAMLALGLLLNLARGTWLGLAQETEQVWILPAGAAWGWLDGLLFSLSGFATGLVLFFLLYLFGMAAGGDLKLAAALGAWVGPWHILFILLGTAVIMVLFGFADLARRLIRRGPQKALFSLGNRPRGKDGKPLAAGLQRRKSLVAYALPIAITTAILVLLWNSKQLLGVEAAPRTTDAAQAATAPQ